MPVKIARSAPRPSFGLPELLVAIHTSRQSCSKAGKARIFTPVRESSGESRFAAKGRASPSRETSAARYVTVGYIRRSAAHEDTEFAHAPFGGVSLMFCSRALRLTH